MAKKELIFALVLLTSALCSSAASYAAVGPSSSSLFLESKTFLSPLETITRDAITLSIEEARSTRTFLFVFSTTTSVRRNRPRSEELRNCLEHLTETVVGIRFNLMRMRDVTRSTLHAEAMSVKDRASRLADMDNTCAAALAGVNKNIKMMLRRRLSDLAMSTGGALKLIEQMKGANPPKPM